MASYIKQDIHRQLFWLMAMILLVCYKAKKFNFLKICISILSVVI